MVIPCDPQLSPRLTIASGNPIKVSEIEAMLSPLSLEVRLQPADLDVEETGSTYLENASLKAVAAAQRTNDWALADDSGLEVDGLQGAPGLPWLPRLGLLEAKSGIQGPPLASIGLLWLALAFLGLVWPVLGRCRVQPSAS